jgi:signal transduction histidine kinase
MHVNTLVMFLIAFYFPVLALTARSESAASRRMIFAIYCLSGLVLLISAVPFLGWVEMKGEWNIHAANAQVLVSEFLIFILLRQRIKQRNIQYQQAELNKHLAEQQLNIERARREEQGRFMVMLSHELKTPLAVMRMSLGTQLDGQPPDKKRMRVEKALEEVNAIVERCLQVDKLEQRNTLVRLENCRLQKILEEIRLVSAEPACVDMRIAALPMIKSDIQLLHVILANLIDNALKYAALESPVQVSAQALHKDGVAGVCVAVENTPGSAGMPDPERVFSKYYRSPGAHRKTGSGLGLYLVHSMTALLGGEIVYCPGPEKVRFELWLPQGA